MDVSEVHVCCLEPSNDISVFLHNQTHGSEPHLTLVIFTLCRYCFSPSPKIHCQTAVGSPCPFHYVPEQLEFCMDGNADPCGEFSKSCICLSEV
jgi:hypothetical protein